MQQAPSGASVPVTVVTVPQQTISPTFQESTGSAAEGGGAPPPPPPPPGPVAAQLPVEAAAVMATAQVVAAVAASAGNAAAVAAAATAAATAAVEFGQFSNQQALAQLESDKRAVYRHPLFPLLALLFEKCELATQSTECPSSDGFDVDIEAFVQHQEQDRKPFFSDDSEVDALMVKAIQVLRIHLLELEKVQELCKDFCTRYITCLKSKMQSENLLRSDYPASSSYGNSSPSSDSGDSRHSVQSVVVNSNSNSMSNSMTVIHPGSTAVSTHVVSGGTVYQMVQTPQGIVAQPIQLQTATPVQAVAHHGASTTPLHVGLHPEHEQQHAVHGQTPLSQIGSGGGHGQLHRESDSLGSLLQAEPSTPTSQEEDDDILGRKKQKRGVLPKQATSVMRSWLFQHIVHPYPTEDEKKQIAAQTNLTLLQVNNWFINARRRILQPMLDASNPDSSHKAKKAKTQSSRPVQRFWPENIANLQPQLLLQGGGVSKSDSESKSGSARESDITSTTEHPVDGSLRADSRNGDIDADEDSSLDRSPADVDRTASALSLDCDSDSSGMGD